MEYRNAQERVQNGCKNGAESGASGYWGWVELESEPLKNQPANRSEWTGNASSGQKFSYRALFPNIEFDKWVPVALFWFVRIVKAGTIVVAVLGALVGVVLLLSYLLELVMSGLSGLHLQWTTFVRSGTARFVGWAIAISLLVVIVGRIIWEGQKNAVAFTDPNWTRKKQITEETYEELTYKRYTKKSTSK